VTSGDHQGFLYGRITTMEGATFEGRLRWGGIEEAFWNDYFSGSKDENQWALYAPPEQLKENQPLEVFGIKILNREVDINLRRPFMARFGDIVRIEVLPRDIRVTLKSGAVFELDRRAADDLADGLRIWDDERGVVDFHETQLRLIELLPDLRSTAPNRLHGTVRTTQGSFTGFVVWDRRDSVGTDELRGKTPDGELSVRFDDLSAIERSSLDSARVTLLDGSEVVLSGTPEVGEGHHGIYVHDRRYGRVLISWDAFERLDLSAAGSGPAYGEFPPGHALTGSVTTRDGRRLTGRLVFDLDESETIETLDAPAQGVNYAILLGLVASVVPAASTESGTGLASVILHSGQTLELEARGDLGEGNAGMLIFVEGREGAEYVPWVEVGRVDFDRPPAMFPPFGESATATN
jgi:hypothetical protein